MSQGIVVLKFKNTEAGRARDMLQGWPYTLMRERPNERGRSANPQMARPRFTIFTPASAPPRARPPAAQPYVEHALILNAGRIGQEAPSGKDAALDRDVIRAESTLNALDESIENLIRSLEHRPSLLLSDRLRDAEAERLKVSAKLDDLYARVAIKSGPLVGRRIDDLHAALTAEPINREAANVALRQLFRSAVINVKEGTLELDWAHSSDEHPPLVLVVSMPPEVTRKVLAKKPPKGKTAGRRKVTGK